MNKLVLLMGALLLSSSLVHAENSSMTGTVSPKCSVYTDVNAVYGNPLPYSLTTLPSSGGVKGSVRIDVIQAGYYKARFTSPVAWSSAPPLNDAGAWTGSVTLGQVSVAGMSVYTANMTSYNNVQEVPLSIAGTTWFFLNSTFAYGNTKSLPSGTYVSIYKVECIAL